ncbi:hypothetical protein K505DRAFT_357457 [Melanomma pulvis-pyrius CBS 109.77]|uniref:Uncharacterized protein n=1 Tax=Melanomma pulvis-pyrius CBS 109.77 TaxID=1314802 RepID=A0A6A6XPQ7_9PLEO|nr:hypothetical protein K505DRAFT_357457 [Melanomma pulvis-pyrius CBS 109.77]
MVSPQAVRRGILTASITIITATGAIYGAGLKSNHELKQERKRRQEATPEDMITQLEAVRSNLVREKTELEIKIAKFTARRIGNAEENKGAR